MKKRVHTLKQILAVCLTVLMLLSVAPIGELSGLLFGLKAFAGNRVDNYSATAGVEYARRYALNYNREWYFYTSGGDCANFVSQSLFAGGMSMSSRWHCYDSNSSAYCMDDFTWIRAHDLMQYLVDLGGTKIVNPSPDQFDLGDAVFYDWNLDGGMNHSAIVTAIDNGVPKVSAHSTPESQSVLDNHWTYGHPSTCCVLVKLYGAKCDNNYAQSYDIFRPNEKQAVMSNPGWIQRNGDTVKRFVLRVPNANPNGYSAFNFEGYTGYVDLSRTTKIGHWDKINVSHLMGNWYIKQAPTCNQKGIEERVCSRCKYTEQREIGMGGVHQNVVPADCLNPSYCKACGAILSDPLGHIMGAWEYDKAPTCLEGGTEKRVCSRCGFTENRDCSALGHNYDGNVALAGCVTTGASYYKCTRCGDIKYENSSWSAYSATIPENADEFLNGFRNLFEAETYRNQVLAGNVGYTVTGSDSASFTVKSTVEDGFTPVSSQAIPVVGGKTYLLQADMKFTPVASNSFMEPHIFWYQTDDANASYDSYSKINVYTTTNTTLKFVVTAPNNAAFARIRFDINETGNVLKIANPMFAEAETALSKVRTEYRSRKKETKDSLNASEPGWTLFNTTSTLSNWSNWSDWQDTPIDNQYNEGDLVREVATQTVPASYKTMYHYYHYCLQKADGQCLNYPSDADVYNQGGWKPVTLLAVHSISIDHPLTYKGTLTTPTNWTTYYYDGYPCCASTDNYPERWFNDEADSLTPLTTQEVASYKTQYRYRTRTKTYTYHFFKWGDWSSWSTNPVKANDNTQVETRTTYSFRQDALDHNWGPEIVVAPKCHEDGYTTKVCNRCGLEIEHYNITPALGDIWGEWKLISDENGEKTYRRDCTNFPKEDGTCECGHAEFKSEKDCIYDPVHTVSPTCTEDGYTVYRCKVHQSAEECEALESVYEYRVPGEPALGHEPDNNWVVITPATCENDGRERCRCVRYDNGETCSKEFEQTLKKTGHDYQLKEKVDPKCTVNGHEYYECANNADHNYTVTLEKTGHNMGEEKHYLNGKESDDTTACGEHKWVSCCVNEGCDYKEERYQFLDHTFGADQTINPTCVADGIVYHNCENCGYYEEIRRIDALGHNFAADDLRSYDATCTKEGLDAYTCARANCGVENDKIILPIGHATSPLEEDYVISNDKMELISSEPNVCGSGSVDTYRCTHVNIGERCDYAVVIGEANDHDLGDYIITKEPTCTKHGYRHKECQNNGCPYRTEDEMIEPLGHLPGEAYIEKASCTKRGARIIDCKNCSQTLEEYTIHERNHNFSEWSTVADATCETDGLERRYCMHTNETDEYTACSNEETRPIHALGHDWGEWKTTTESTVYSGGVETRICKRDPSHKETRETDPLPSFEVTFVVGEETVQTVRVAKGAKYVDEPDLTAYQQDNKTVVWEEYTLNDEDITIHAIITEIDPNEVADGIDTEKTVDQFENGNATITLSASSLSRLVKFESSSTKPVDVIMVLDLSGSMDEKMGNQETKMQALKNCTNTFLNALNENAAATGADHRVALVGFASGEKVSGYSMTSYENTGLIVTQDGGFVSYKSNNINNSYAKAWMPTGDALGVDARLTAAVNGLTAGGSTNTQLGLKMAQNILSTSSGDGREKIVLLITDGVPTVASIKADEIRKVAPLAVTYANEIKNLGVKLYTVGVDADADENASFTAAADGVTVKNGTTTFDFNRFLNIVSSNYPGAKAMNDYGTKQNSGYYMSVNHTDKLNEIFEKVLYSSVYKKLNFQRCTLVDTLSKDFVLTMEQEQALKDRLAQQYNLSDANVMVRRNEDGTTTLRIVGVPVVKCTENGKIVYRASVTFEAALAKYTAGEYATNTEDAYVEVDGERAADFAVPEKVTLNADRNIVVFTLNGTVYRIEEGNFGDVITAPVSDLAKWNIPEGTEITSSYTVFEADEISTDTYTVTWSINGTQTTDSYHFGDAIQAPEVADLDDLAFAGFMPWVPATMPARNMTFTATYAAKHTHAFVQTVAGNCKTDLRIVKTCACGETVVEAQPAREHQFSAVVDNLEGNTLTDTLVCSVCGASEQHTLTFQTVKSTWGGTTVLDLSLEKAGTVIQPAAGSTIKIMVPWTNQGYTNTNVKVIRVNEQGVQKTYTATIENGYLIFYADHFSVYLVEELDAQGHEMEPISYRVAVCELNGTHSYTDVVTAPTCTSKGYTTHTCSSCGDSYTDSETSFAAHTLKHVDAKAATTEAEGNVEYYHCSVCGKNFSDANGTKELTKVTTDKLPQQDEPTTEKPKDDKPAKDYSACKYCGEQHTGAFGWLIKIIHSILALFGLHK